MPGQINEYMAKLQVMNYCSCLFCPYPEFLLEACGDEDRRAGDAARWLTSLYITNLPKMEKVWTILGGNQVLWGNLLEKTIGG